MASLFSRPRSLLVAWMLFFLIVYLRYYFPVKNIISWDVFGYYLYLPALFIHNDLGIKNLDWVRALVDQYQNTATLYQLVPGPEGVNLIKYSSGMAVMYLPFFFIAHALAPILGYAADGLSMPYQQAMVLAGLFYSLLGILLLRNLLLRYFTDGLTAILLLLVIAGTNYLQMAYAGGLLTHNVLFPLYTLVLLLTVKWYEQAGRWTAGWLGLTIGLIALIRPTDALILLVPALYGIQRKSDLHERYHFLLLHWRSLLFFALAFLIAGLPQLLYWKVFTGKFLFYSYVNPGEGFDFLNPHTPAFLFSFRKGWLVYTPLMCFALAGFWALYRMKREWFWPLTGFFVLYIYVVSSWTCWYYAGSLGQRPMVQTYPLLALPLGFILLKINELKPLKRDMAYTLAILLLLLNLFQHWQYSFRWIIDPSRMTAAYYFRVFGKTGVDQEDQKLLLVERSVESTEYLRDTADYTSKTIFFLGFEKHDPVALSGLVDTLAYSGQSSFLLDSTVIYSPGMHLKYKELTKHDHAWIRASVWVYSPGEASENPMSLVLTFTHQGKAYKYRALDIESGETRVEKGKWIRLEVDYITPEVRSKKDQLSVYCWLRGKKPVLIDDLQVRLFEPKD